MLEFRRGEITEEDIAVAGGLSASRFRYVADRKVYRIRRFVSKECDLCLVS
jgi:hypothetical protein